MTDRELIESLRREVAELRERVARLEAQWGGLFPPVVVGPGLPPDPFHHPCMFPVTISEGCRPV